MDVQFINRIPEDADVPRHFYDIEAIWTGFRTCYSNKVDFNDAMPFTFEDFNNPDKADSVDKIVASLKDLYVKDYNAVRSKYLQISKKYGYPAPADANAEALFDDMVKNMVNYRYAEGLNPKWYLKGFNTLWALNALKFIAPKLKMGHESPLEHSILTFKVQGCSRSLTHQLVRHRLASYSQSSQRYISENPDNLDFVIPAKVQENPEALKIVQDYLSRLPDCIKRLKSLGIKNEDIRCIYPNAITTDIQVSMNFRELRHFLLLRLSKHAQDEIRYLAYIIYVYLTESMPLIWTDLEFDA